MKAFGLGANAKLAAERNNRRKARSRAFGLDNQGNSLVIDATIPRLPSNIKDFWI